jgi:flagellar motor switch protein FliN
MTSASAPTLALHPFADAIRKALAEVFAQKFGYSWNVETSAKDAAPDSGEKQLSFMISASGACQGLAAFGLAQSDALLLATHFADPSSAPGELRDEQKSAVQDLLQEIINLASNLLEAGFGKTDLAITSTESPTLEGAGIVLRVSDAAPRTVTFYLLISNELIDAMLSSSELSAGPDKKTIVSETNLDLLMGVDLTLTLRFGTRTLTLREILDLSSGSVVELDRQVQEPADLLLGDKLVARGEVVIVDGNYGLRITELPEQGQVAKSTDSGQK